ncbi:hypothetical protein D7D52_09665 [Nocardia yunnanensis]|uniref:Uncharacterized protein n=1 Tax=Nocardia yunnanensis TaxID=2382165 RepID=A0A386Z900_9NOCA|nr:hypothetical protein [Nocardia yunnanensis]AYF74088.1 hypothetical protein D7D52_09665 [Nocardia yunnanensis]
MSNSGSARKVQPAALEVPEQLVHRVDIACGQHRDTAHRHAGGHQHVEIRGHPLLGVTTRRVHPQPSDDVEGDADRIETIGEQGATLLVEQCQVGLHAVGDRHPRTEDLDVDRPASADRTARVA